MRKRRRLGPRRKKRPGEPITTTQAAKLGNVSPSTLLRAVANKKIRSFKTPGGHFRIFPSDVLDFFKGTPSNEQELRSELSVYKATFELQRIRVAEAQKHWQKATGRKDVTPDLGQLVAWLMDKAGLKYKNTGLGKSPGGKFRNRWAGDFVK